MIERKDCNIAGGKQDHYSAAFGGFNSIDFYCSHTVVKPLDIKNWFLCELESSILLHFTGVSRASSKIIEDQKKLTIDSADKIGIYIMKKEVSNMKNGLLRSDKVAVEDSKRSWDLKNSTSSKISSNNISQQSMRAIVLEQQQRRFRELEAVDTLCL